MSENTENQQVQQEQVEKKEVEQKNENVSSTEEKKEEKKDTREERVQRSLKDYWYPQVVGEQNEIVPSLKANVKRASTKTKVVDWIVKLIILGVIVLGLKLVTSPILGMYDTSVPLFSETNKTALIVTGVVIIIVVSIGVFIYARMDPTIYLVGFETALPPEEYIVTNEQFAQYVKDIKIFNETSCDFLGRLVHRAGLGSQTALPPAFHVNPPDDSYAMGRKEFEITIKSSCDALFEKLKIDPTKDIDFVVTNCSMFAPTPSLGAMIMNIYKMKQTCKNISLGGMGCSAGLVSIDLAKDLLRCYKNVNVLVYSTESITRGWYGGQEKGKLLSNTLFRMGAGAILMSNKRKWKNVSPYQLVTTVRVNHQKYDDSHHAIYQSEDVEGIVGVNLSKDLLKCVTRALIQNMNMLMPQVMSYLDFYRFIVHFIKQQMGKLDKKDQFKPNFRETFQAYCIHAGGRGIIDGIQDSMGLTDEDCMPSRATLYRFGNTSSSSIWYEFKFIERTEILKKGDKIWQIAFGSGLKCNSCVWKKIN